VATAGAAWHLLGYRQKDNSNYRVSEHGPEALLGVAVPCPGQFSVRAAGTLLPVVLVSDSYKYNASTYGYGLDFSLGTKIAQWGISAGYRTSHIAENSVTKAQDFRGPYAVAAYSW
jgi:hypothetical protein